MDYEMDAIKDYIQVKGPWEIKNDISIFRINTLIWGPLLLFPCEWHRVFQVIVAISFLIILVWGWLESRDIEKHQKTHWLYFGISSFLLSVMFLLGAIGLFEHMIFKPFEAILGVVAGYLFILVAGGYFHLYTVRQGYLTIKSQNRRAKKQRWIWGLVAIIPGIMLIFPIVMKNSFSNIYYWISMLSIPAASYLCLTGTVGIHRYYLLKKYEPYVRVFHLTKKNNIKTAKWTNVGE